jgi:ABC-2 type transport system permease protein
MMSMGTLAPLNFLLLFVFLVSAMVLIYAIWSLLHTLAFWFVKVDNISQFFYAIFQTAPFPATAFPPRLRFVFTFVIPVAFMTTVPASAAAGAVDWRFGIASPIVAGFSLWLAHRFWQRALRHYSSASS